MISNYIVIIIVFYSIFNYSAYKIIHSKLSIIRSLYNNKVEVCFLSFVVSNPANYRNLTNVLPSKDWIDDKFGGLPTI